MRRRSFFFQVLEKKTPEKEVSEKKAFEKRALEKKMPENRAPEKKAPENKVLGRNQNHGRLGLEREPTRAPEEESKLVRREARAQPERNQALGEGPE